MDNTMITRENFMTVATRDGYDVPLELRKVWKVMLDMLEVFMSVCEKYDLKWAMDGGSLLGAIRHKGFIPWDDDMDIQMPRRDFDKLMEVLPREISHPMFLHTFYNNNESMMAYVRLMNVETTAIEANYVSRHLPVAMGIHVDIIPIDGVPRSGFVKKVANRYAHFLFGILVNKYRLDNASIYDKIRHRMGELLASIFGVNRIYRWRDNVYRHFPFRENGWGATMPANYGYASHSLRSYDWFREYKEVPFEYLMVRVPIGWEGQLNQLYGSDWRVPKKDCAFHGGLNFNLDKNYKSVLVAEYGYDEGQLDKLP